MAEIAYDAIKGWQTRRPTPSPTTAPTSVPTRACAVPNARVRFGFAPSGAAWTEAGVDQVVFEPVGVSESPFPNVEYACVPAPGCYEVEIRARTGADPAGLAFEIGGEEVAVAGPTTRVEFCVEVGGEIVGVPSPTPTTASPTTAAPSAAPSVSPLPTTASPSSRPSPVPSADCARSQERLFIRRLPSGDAWRARVERLTLSAIRGDSEIEDPVLDEWGVAGDFRTESYACAPRDVDGYRLRVETFASFATDDARRLADTSVEDLEFQIGLARTRNVASVPVGTRGGSFDLAVDERGDVVLSPTPIPTLTFAPTGTKKSAKRGGGGAGASVGLVVGLVVASLVFLAAVVCVRFYCRYQSGNLFVRGDLPPWKQAKHLPPRDQDDRLENPSPRPTASARRPANEPKRTGTPKTRRPTLRLSGGIDLDVALGTTVGTGDADAGPEEQFEERRSVAIRAPGRGFRF